MWIRIKTHVYFRLIDDVGKLNGQYLVLHPGDIYEVSSLAANDVVAVFANGLERLIDKGQYEEIPGADLLVHLARESRSVPMVISSMAYVNDPDFNWSVSAHHRIR